VLRAAGSEDSATGVRFRDAMLTSLGEGTHVLVQAAQPVLVFINGKCWGHYNLREKVNRAFIAQHEGITDPELIDRIEILTGTGTALHGDNAEYKALIAFLKKSDLSEPKNLAYVLARMDVDSFFDHCIFEIVTGNRDVVNNIKFYRVPGDKWKWILYDLDTAMSWLADAPLRFYMADKNAKPLAGLDHAPFAALMEAPEMREKFLTRMGQLIADRFVYTSLSVLLDDWRRMISPVIPYQIERWGRLTPKKWDDELTRLDYCLRNRPPAVVEHMRTAFKLTDEEVRRYFGTYLDTAERQSGGK